MKKLIMTLLIAVFGVTFTVIDAQVTLHQTLTTEVEDTVHIYYVEEVEPGVVEFVWQANTLNEAFIIKLAAFDTTTYASGKFVQLVYYSNPFKIIDNVGYYYYSTDMLLQYGDKYETISKYGVDSLTVEEWKTNWEVSVNYSTFTLKRGFYVLFVEGIDSLFVTTSMCDYIIVQIKDHAECSENVYCNNIYSNKSTLVKVFDGGKLYIICNDNIYDIFGNRIK